MIGLKRHVVKIVDHNPYWIELAANLSDEIYNIAGGLILDIQHVGSTSVPDLPAKPIIDLAISVNSIKTIPKLVKELVKGGFIDRGDQGDQGGYLLVKDSQPDVRVAHIHIVEKSDVQWQKYIDFRDALKSNATLRKEYSLLKQKLADEYVNDRISYTDEKHDFIKSAIGQ